MGGKLVIVILVGGVDWVAPWEREKPGPPGKLRQNRSTRSPLSALVTKKPRSDSREANTA